MNVKAFLISLAAGGVATWATRQIVKELKVPAYAAPFVGVAVGAVVNNAVARPR